MSTDKTNGKITPIEWQMMIDEERQNLPYIIEYLALDSHAMKARYDALVKEGFTADQALEIVKARGSRS